MRNIMPYILILFILDNMLHFIQCMQYAFYDNLASYLTTTKSMLKMSCLKSFVF